LGGFFANGNALGDCVTASGPPNKGIKVLATFLKATARQTNPRVTKVTASGMLSAKSFEESNTLGDKLTASGILSAKASRTLERQNFPRGPQPTCQICPTTWWLL